MQVNRCPKCMEVIQSLPCPHCGFVPNSNDIPMFSLRPNHILNGRYLVGKMLGQGGFGITYIGFDLNLHRRVAIKEFYPFGQVNRVGSVSSTVLWSTDERTTEIRQQGLQSFKREAEKMVRLEQVPQVVQVHDVFSENETAYIVMEFAEGETLKAILQREGPLPWARVQRIFYPIISAMDRVHRAGMVHRDISPDNLMIDPRGRARILDLGAAKDLFAERDGPSILVAKNGFSPLEQYGQRGGSGPWTDVYAMAATMYYTLTGHLPPSAIDRLENDGMNWNDPLLAPVPDHAVKALKHAMAVSMKERTQDMAAFLRELNGKPAVPVPDPVPASAYPQSASTGSTVPSKVPLSQAPSSAQVPSSLQIPGSSQVPPSFQIPNSAQVHPSFQIPNSAQVHPISQVPSISQVPPVSQQVPPVSKVVTPPSPPSKEPRSKLPIILGAAGAGVVCLVLVFLFAFTCTLGHRWKDATCTAPKTCSRCGQTEGLPAAHAYGDADCTAPKTCANCGSTTGEPLGHSFDTASCTVPGTCSRCGAVSEAADHTWLEATYTAPKTCSVCGATEGEMKGLLGTVEGSWSAETSVVGGIRNKGYELNPAIKRCFKLELQFTLDEVYGDYTGTWTIWVRDPVTKTWKSINTFNVPEGSANKRINIPLSFPNGLDLDAITVNPSNTNLKWSMDLVLADVHVWVD